MKVGYFNSSIEKTEKDWLEILYEVVGDNGDIICPAYTPSFFKYKRNKDLIFHEDMPSTSGALSNILIKSANSIRSSHPTNSYIGFGSRAEQILMQHDETKGAYQVFEDILLFNPKHLMMGTIIKGHAPLPFHQILYSIGHNNKHPLSGLMQVYFMKNGKKRIFTRNDIGGCSDGGIKLLAETINLSKSQVGEIGRAKTLVLDVAQAYKKYLISYPMTQALHYVTIKLASIAMED